MKHAEFYPSLKTNNEIIDGQHKALIDAINNLYDAIDSGAGPEGAKKALDFLAQYTIFHFGGEEKLWAANGYPLFTEHKAAHDAFVKTVRDLYLDLDKNGLTDDFAKRVEKEVTNWLINHIQGADMKGIEWLNTRINNKFMENML
ncbi:MAG: bacteriohemerythrin [Acidaminococcaceae bacterium]|nr:bacteriohemerythrin [Acidaminococcaceae bacterium]